MTTSAIEGGEGTGTPAAPAAAPATIAAPLATTTPAAAPVVTGITSDQLKIRLDETRASTLKELGFQSIAEGKKAMEAFKQFQQSQLTEQEKTAARIRELEPHEKAAVEYRAKYEKAVEREFNRLPEAMRAAIDEQSKREDGTVDAAAREMLMTAFAKFTAATPAVVVDATSQTVVTPKPASAAATPPAPKPAATKSKFDEFVDLQKSRPTAASAFYQAHQRDIEASRPSS